MKSLLKIIAGLVCVLLFSSCRVYQHVRLASYVPRNNNSEFQIENDSLSIMYSFNGQSGPIYIELFNKLDKPIYVDWSKSALIVDEQSYPFWKNEAKMSGTSTQYEVITPEGTPGSIGNLDGTIVKQDKVSFIPPHSKIAKNSIVLQTALFSTPGQAGEKTLLYTKEGNRKAMKFSFSPEDSPLNFRIFLSLSMDQGFNNPIQVDNTFWVSEYYTTSVSPSLLGIYPGNQFYNWKRTSFSRTMGVVSTVGILVIGSAFSDTAGN